MRLDRYIGEQPKFRVLRRQSDGSYKEVPAFDYFVLALKDRFVPDALSAYAAAAERSHEFETANDVARLADEARSRPDQKIPD